MEEVKYVPLYKDKAWLKAKYEDEGLTSKQIGALCNVSYKLINAYLRDFGLVSERAAMLLVYP